MGPVPRALARRLTTHAGLETRPVWSHDGTRIAFASDRHGNFDVFVMASAGGPATRLTWHSAPDFPCDFEPDGARVLFSSRRQDAPEALLASAYQPELWSVAVTGGRPRRELTTPAEWARVSPDGRRLVYEDRRGYENTWRKHHVSPVTRDIWIHDRETGTHVRVTDHGCEDLNPVWVPGEGEAPYDVLFLSQCDGTFNVHRDGAVPVRLTAHTVHPVRFLSAAADGTFCYGFNGAVFVAAPGGEPRRVPIRAAADDRENPVRRTTERKGATEMAVAPDGEEVAFVLRGEVFVASVEYGTTKRITTTPEQERSVAWAPDGKALYYAGERRRDGSDQPSWNLYRAMLAREDDERFHRATLLREEPVLADAHETFQPAPSPDGTKLAFLRDRDALCVLELETGEVRTLIAADQNYSYADGDIRFAWSPDSRWIAATYLPNRSWIEQIGVVDVATGEVRDVTLSGYQEGEPTWAPDGRSLAFVSNRHGRRSHGSWGSDDDVLALYLNRAAYDRARLDEEEFERLREKEEGVRDEEAPPPVPEVRIEWEGLERRLERRTFHSAPMSGYALSPDGETCLYAARMDDRWHVWRVRPRTGETQRLVHLGDEEGPRLELSRDGKTLFLLREDGRIAKADVERALRSEPGRRGGRGDEEEDGGGGGHPVRVEAVPFAAELEVDGPAERADSRIRPGHRLVAIDGNAIEGASVNPWPYLRGKAGRRVRLALEDDAGERYEQVLRPISLEEEARLLYRRLIERRRAIVDEASGGRVGYVHVAGMNDRSFRETFREALGRNADREALVVDTRFNGGGWLHDDLVVFLSGRRYMDFVPRGKARGRLGGEPLHRWDKPSCVLVSEGNYSDAHLFPVAYRMHGIGKVVGAPVAGTGTAVWWERLIDPGLVFGIPQVGMVDPDGNVMENRTLVPDVVVPTDPARIADGVDEQLLAAVRVLLAELDGAAGPEDEER